MRFGIRAQLLLYLAALLVLAFAPLFFAVASLAHASFAQSWERNARSLGRAIAGHVAEARRQRPPAELDALLDAQTSDSVGAIGLYDAGGKLVRKAGEQGAVDALPAEVPVAREQVIETRTPRGTALVVLVPGPQGPVGALLHTDPAAVRSGPLVRLIALYVGLLGLALLVFAYFMLTRLVVNPIVGLSQAAGRVAEGARELRAPVRGGRELIELSSSLATMTSALRGEEEQLRNKVDELKAAHDELKRAQDTVIRSERLASVGRLAAGLAHEIGNPIAAILAFQELMLDGELADDQRDFVERMKRETERVNRVLRDLLDFARPARNTEPDIGDVFASVGAAIGHVVSLVRPQKSFADVELMVTVDEALPAVGMRAERIEQVLLNLLLNAADEVPKPGGIIAVRALEVDGKVTVHIEDNGGGVVPSVRDRVFEPFVTTKEIGKGTGLGLAVCRGLVEAAGGTISIEDGAAGARFVLQLPAADLPDDDSDDEPIASG